MKSITSQKMRELDSWAIQKIGIPGIVLMENAGKAVASYIIKEMGLPKKALIIAGKGNNGGDGYVIARYLHNRGVKVTIFLISSQKEIQGDAKINLEIAKKLNIPIRNSGFEALLKDTDIIIDGILGTGFKGELKGKVATIINKINAFKGKIISIDVPSANRVKADLTIAFHAPKKGFNTSQKTVVVDIGIPKQKKRPQIEIGLPQRASDTHKKACGRVLVIAGSKGMLGAGILATRAALRTGVGLVTWAVPAELVEISNLATPEVMVIPFNEKSINIKDYDVLAIGPGIGFQRTSLVKKIISLPIPMVIDADALTIIAKDLSILKQRRKATIITPHPGEMQRLTGQKVVNRLQVAKNFAKQQGVITVLKGEGTIVSSPQGDEYINPTGNPGMATAGMGDVLTGVIASLLAQGLPGFKAAKTGVFLHGITGDLIAQNMGERGLLASDVIKNIPLIIQSIHQKG